MDNKIKEFYLDQINFFTDKAKKKERGIKDVVRLGLDTPILDQVVVEFYKEVAALAKKHLEK